MTKDKNFAQELDNDLSTLHDETFDLLGVLPPKPKTQMIPDGAIVPQGDGSWLAGNVRITSTGLDVEGIPTQEQWLQLGKLVQRVESSYQWLVGDWIVGCQNLWADTYQDVIEATGYEYSTVRDLAYIARNVPLSVRTDKVKFGHYKLIAALRLEDGTPDINRQRYYVNLAAEKELSRSELRAAIKDKPARLPKKTSSRDLISPATTRAFNDFLRVAKQAKKGDKEAKRQALEQSAFFREWLDQVVEWISE